jgi:hypothetical protein
MVAKSGVSIEVVMSGPGRHWALSASCLVYPGGFNRSAQHLLILRGEEVCHGDVAVLVHGIAESRASKQRGGDVARVLRVAIPSRRRLKSGDGLITAELPLMVTASDGVMALRLCASKVHHVRKLGGLHIRHAPYSLRLTKQTFIYATAMSALGP